MLAKKPCLIKELSQSGNLATYFRLAARNLCVLLGACLAASAFAQTSIKPGLWEVSGKEKFQACVTPEEAKQGIVPVQRQGKCTTKTSPLTGNTASITFTCTAPPASGEGQVTFQSDTAYTMTLRIKGQSRDEQMSGRWLSANCTSTSASSSPARGNDALRVRQGLWEATMALDYSEAFQLLEQQRVEHPDIYKYNQDRMAKENIKLDSTKMSDMERNKAEVTASGITSQTCITDGKPPPPVEQCRGCTYRSTFVDGNVRKVMTTFTCPDNSGESEMTIHSDTAFTTVVSIKSPISSRQSISFRWLGYDCGKIPGGSTCSPHCDGIEVCVKHAMTNEKNECLKMAKTPTFQEALKATQTSAESFCAGSSTGVSRPTAENACKKPKDEDCVKGLTSAGMPQKDAQRNCSTRNADPACYK